MGYLYASGGGALCCDSCGASGREAGTRKRKCPHVVRGATEVSWDGRMVRRSLPYCSAPALCKECYRREGGLRGVHAQCAAPAAEAQNREDLREARLQAGEWQVKWASSDSKLIPEGHVLVGFRNLQGEERERVFPRDVYRSLSGDIYESDLDALMAIGSVLAN